MPRYRTAQPYDDGKQRLEVTVTFAMSLEEVFVAILGEIADDIPFRTLNHLNHNDWSDADLRRELHESVRVVGIGAFSNYDRLPDEYSSHPHALALRRRLARLFGFHEEQVG